MGKADRGRQRDARERIAAQQAAARAAQTRRRALLAGGAVLAVIVVVVVMVVVSSLSGPPAATATGGSIDRQVTDSVAARQVTSVPASVLDVVGAGPADSAHKVGPLSPLAGQSPLTQGGKPEVLYIGAEYCPYCAAERWAVTVALSRFGTWSGLRFIRSAPNDVYSNTATLTFYGARYSSPYLSFVSVEEQTVSRKPLQTPTSEQAALLQRIASGNYPFLDVAGQYASVGAQFLPDALGTSPQQDPSHFGLTWAQIVGALQNPRSLVAQQILGAANHITAAICKATNGQPGTVCGSAGVRAVSGSV